MKVFLGFANIKEFTVNNVRVYCKDGKDIILKKIEKTYHQENCWKGWHAHPAWKEYSMGRLLIILSCGHYFSTKCFFEHSFEKCPHCHMSITNDDKKGLSEQLYQYFPKIRATKCTSVKTDSMYLLCSLLEESFESDFKRWTEIACEMYNFRANNSYLSRTCIPALIILNYIMNKHRSEKNKIFELIRWEDILSTIQLVIKLTQDFTFLSHLNFLRESLLFSQDEDRIQNLIRLDKLQDDVKFFQIHIPIKYQSEQTTALFNSIRKNIYDEIERNRFMLNVEGNDSESEKESEEYIGDYDLKQYRDEQEDSDFDYKIYQILLL